MGGTTRVRCREHLLGGRICLESWSSAGTGQINGRCPEKKIRSCAALAILTLVNRLKICGVRVLSYQESWTEAPGELGELLFAIAGWVTRMESQRRSERTKAGLVRLVAQGKKLGRPKGSKDKRKRKKRISFSK